MTTHIQETGSSIGQPKLVQLKIFPVFDVLHWKKKGGSCPFKEEGGFNISTGGGPRGSKGQGASQCLRCWKFNEGNCTFLDCSFRHVCAKCNGRHPAIAYKCPANDKGGPASAPYKGTGGSFARIPTKEIIFIQP